MASKYNANLVDIQNDDVEINFDFQDFEDTSPSKPRPNEQKSDAVYFNSFPDSPDDDDQEQKLLADEGSESTSKSVHSFWTFKYYQQFFDVESKQVGDRIIWSMVPKPGINYLQSCIRPNPDLYGPFWICITLVFTTAVAGNLSNYLQSASVTKWRYDFHKVTLATSLIFSYAWLVPLVIWGVLIWRGSKANVSLLEMICLYGYSLAIFVPVSLLWMIPLRWLQWCLGIVAAVLSGSVLVRTIQPAVSHEARRVALALGTLILLLHAAIALGFMLYFFYPPNVSSPALSPVVPSEQSVLPNAPVGLQNGKLPNVDVPSEAKVKDSPSVDEAKVNEGRSRKDIPHQPAQPSSPILQKDGRTLNKIKENPDQAIQVTKDGQIKSDSSKDTLNNITDKSVQVTKEGQVKPDLSKVTLNNITKGLDQSVKVTQDEQIKNDSSKATPSTTGKPLLQSGNSSTKVTIAVTNTVQKS